MNNLKHRLKLLKYDITGSWQLLIAFGSVDIVAQRMRHDNFMPYRPQWAFYSKLIKIQFFLGRYNIPGGG